jgi:DHA3 family macrolide efflux protein-like MFS transporter
MAKAATGMRAYVIVWAGQFISLVGSNMTAFGMEVWVFRKSGSVAMLGLILALSVLPFALVSPFTGSLVDRWGAQRSLVVSNAGYLFLTLLMAVLLLTNSFQLWYVYVVGVALTLVSALAVPAFGALAPVLVPREHLARANALRMVALAVSQSLAPVAGGFVFLASGLGGVVLVDFVTFVVATLSLAFVRIPRAYVVEATTAGARALLADFREAWRFFSARQGLLALMYFLGAVNFSAGFIDVSVAPVVLSFAPPHALGFVLAIGGGGMILTSVAMSALGGPKRRIDAVLGLSLVLAAATIIGALRPNVGLIAAAAFLFLGALGLILAINQTIWQMKVPAAMMGRTMALLNAVMLVPQLLGYLVAGFAADHVFQPLVGRHEVRSQTVARLVGEGPGRGIALMLMVMGVLMAVTVGIAALSPRLRHLEDEVPDVAPEPIAETGPQAGHGAGPGAPRQPDGAVDEPAPAGT